MQDFSYILSLTSPTFMLIAIGYIVVKTGWMPKENVRSLAWFVVNIGLTAALFKALSSRFFQDILHTGVWLRLSFIFYDFIYFGTSKE